MVKRIVALVFGGRMISWSISALNYDRLDGERCGGIQVVVCWTSVLIGK